MTHICIRTCICTRTGQCILMDGIILLHAQEAMQESEGGVQVFPKTQPVVVGHVVVVQEDVVRLMEEAVVLVDVAGEEEQGVVEEGVVEGDVEDVEAEMDKGSSVHEINLATSS